MQNGNVPIPMMLRKVDFKHRRHADMGHCHAALSQFPQNDANDTENGGTLSRRICNVVIPTTHRSVKTRKASVPSELSSSYRGATPSFSRYALRDVSGRLMEVRGSTPAWERHAPAWPRCGLRAQAGAWWRFHDRKGVPQPRPSSKESDHSFPHRSPAIVPAP